jgi:hypothetical protein
MAEQSPPIDEDEDEQFSPLELAELDKIKDPELRKLRAMEIRMQKEAFIEQMRTNMSVLGEKRDLRDEVRKKFRA